MAEERQAVERPQRVSKRDPLVEAVELHLPGYRPDVVFDVGANVGRTAISFARGFPEATVYAFEPVAATFRTLSENVASEARIRPFNLALGRRAGRARMRIQSLSVSNRIATWRDYYRPHETVTMTSGDAFCAEHSIEQIGFLKIDAEGHDLEVLRGFAAMLKSSRVDLVEAEVGMNPENRMHASFGSVQRFLERLGYRLFLLYDFGRDAPFTGRAVLRRCNAVFASPKLVETRRA
jgi:FkbM family methyltransferase